MVPSWPEEWPTMTLRRGAPPVDVKLPGAMGGGGSVVEEETVVPVPPLHLEKTSAKLKNESCDGDTTEIDRITN